LSLDISAALVQTGGARDYSPNNRGFAMADQRMRLNVRVT